jgi:hypothetical protein
MNVSVQFVLIWGRHHDLTLTMIDAASAAMSVFGAGRNALIGSGLLHLVERILRHPVTF